jgi:hypothetical protein
MQSRRALTDAALLQTTVEDKESGHSVAAVNCYFMAQDGGMFKAQVPFAPYFYLQVKVGGGLGVALPHFSPGQRQLADVLNSEDPTGQRGGGGGGLPAPQVHGRHPRH